MRECSRLLLLFCQVEADTTDSTKAASAEVEQLKAKLEKASVALNDLHMSKSDTEKELSSSLAMVRSVDYLYGWLGWL